MLTINPTRWHTRWFRVAHAIWLRFKTGYRAQPYDLSEGVNLCYYIRVQCVWAPLVIALHALLPVVAAYVALVLPFHWFGANGVFQFLVWCAGLGALGYGIFRLLKWRSLTPLKPQTKMRLDSFLNVVDAYLDSIHKGICPFITFGRKP